MSNKRCRHLLPGEGKKTLITELEPKTSVDNKEVNRLGANACQSDMLPDATRPPHLKRETYLWPINLPTQLK